MKLKVDTDIKEDEGIVYVLEIQLEGKALVKVGVTNRFKVEQRVCEILTAIWKKYRIFPQCYVKRYKRTDKVREKEKTIHDYLDEYRYRTEHTFGGSTEVFNIPLDRVVEVYDKVLNGEDLGQNSEECEVCGREKKFLVNGELVCGRCYSDTTVET